MGWSLAILRTSLPWHLLIHCKQHSCHSVLGMQVFCAANACMLCKLFDLCLHLPIWPCPARSGRWVQGAQDQGPATATHSNTNSSSNSRRSDQTGQLTWQQAGLSWAPKSSFVAAKIVLAEPHRYQFCNTSYGKPDTMMQYCIYSHHKSMIGDQQAVACITQHRCHCRARQVSLPCRQTP